MSDTALLDFIQGLGVPAGWAAAFAVLWVFWKFVEKVREDDRRTIEKVTSALTEAANAMNRSSAASERDVIALEQLRVLIETKLK